MNNTSLTPEAVNFLMAEYVALREEIIKRTETQNQIIALCLVAAGTFFSFGLEHSPRMLLVFPILTLGLAGAWSQNDVRIRQIGMYIRKRSQPLLLSGTDAGWEQVTRNMRLESVGFLGSLSLLSSHGILLGLPIAAIFLASRKVASKLEPDEIAFTLIDIVLIIFAGLLLRPPRIDPDVLLPSKG